MSLLGNDVWDVNNTVSECKYSSFCQNPNGARIRHWMNVKLEQGFLEEEHQLGKVGFSVDICADQDLIYCCL